MAPEIIENWKLGANQITVEQASPYGRSADVYSAIVVVWECLTAQLPYVDARDPSTGRKLAGVFLTDAIVGGLRPSNGAIPNGGGSAVSSRMQALVESGWHQKIATRPSASKASAVIEEEIAERQVLHQLVDTNQGPEGLATAPEQSAADEPRQVGRLVIQV